EVVRDVDQRRDQDGAALYHQGDGVVGEPGAVFDAVDTGVDQAGQRVLAEDVCGDPGPVGVRCVDRRLEHVVGPQRGEVADRAVDPVPHHLDPAVAATRLLGDGRRQLGFVVELDGEVWRVALGSGQVLSGADDAGQVVVVIEDARVGR